MRFPAIVFLACFLFTKQFSSAFIIKPQLQSVRNVHVVQGRNKKDNNENVPNKSLSIRNSHNVLFAKDDTSIIMEGNNGDTITSSIDESMSQKKSLPFDKFEYENHWYPCIWARDLEVDEPTKVTIFDVDYVVAKTSTGEVIAMEDFCTHKGAALSEGRITETGNFQCAYHGWSFNGKTGDCVEIPQIVRTRHTKNGGNDDESLQQSSGKIPSRACGTAIPAQIHQEMVWLFPGGGIEKALAAPPPPSFPEYEQGMKMSVVVRDMPVDWPILLNNICDPDHGLFAHQNPDFDKYTAALDCPFESFVTQETDGGKGWSLTTKIDSKDKIMEVDRSLRERLYPKNNKQQKKQQTKDETPWATLHFEAPTTVKMKRIDKQTGETKFVSFFHVCPVGVGRSRFLSGGLSSFSTPRWINHLLVANFVDQDTYLLATQQNKVLSMEADELRTLMKKHGIDRDDTEGIKTLRMTTRKKNFCLASPTDRLGNAIEQLWDATLTRCPNRVKTLLKLDESGAFLQTPTREMVLDRKTQNLDISKDSQDVVQNCRRVQKVTKILSAALVLAKMSSLWYGNTPSPPPSLKPLSAFLSKTILKTSSLCASFIVMYISSFLAKKIEKEYFFKYTDDMRRKDMKKIPKKIWVDL